MPSDRTRYRRDAVRSARRQGQRVDQGGCPHVDPGEAAKKLIRNYDGWKQGRSPSGVAAGAHYIVSLVKKEYETQAEVGSLYGVSKVTVRENHQEIIESNGGWSGAEAVIA